MATEGTENRAGLSSGETDRGRSNHQGSRQVEEGQWVTWLLGMCALTELVEDLTLGSLSSPTALVI